MKKSIITIVFLLIPVYSFAINGDAVTITSREIVEKLAALEGKFLAVDEQFKSIHKQFETVNKKFKAIDEQFKAVNRKIDQRFEAMNQNIDQRFEMVDQKFEIFNQKLDQISNAINQRIDDLIKSIDARFSIFQWIIGGILLGMIYLIYLVLKMQIQMDTMPETIILKIQKLYGNKALPGIIKKQASDPVYEGPAYKEENQTVRLLQETVEILKNNVEDIMEYLKKNTSFNAVAPQPA